MSSDWQKPQGGVPRTRRTSGIIPSSLRAISSYLRIVSSGASSVASTVRSAASAASAIVDRVNDASHDQVLWAGFDKLEWDGGSSIRVLLLGYQSGFQVWDVEEAENVHVLVSRHDGPVSFMQLLPRPIGTKSSGDKFADSRPLLAVCTDESVSGGYNFQDDSTTSRNGSARSCHDPINSGFVPTVVSVYSFRCPSSIHVLKFRSAIYSVRCSTRVVAVLQAAQIHCFDAATLERDYTIITNPIAIPCTGFGGIGYGPLAVGSRWLAYSGSPVAASNSGRISPQSLAPSVCYPGTASNGSLVAHYAKESSKHLAAGIVTLGDFGYKKLSRYYSELLPEGKNSAQSGNTGWKVNGIVNGYSLDTENVGMVIVRDIVSKSVITQFRAHKSPISSLCFDPSGTLLVTASVQGHNINVFRIIPRSSGTSGFDSGASYIHLYRLQRGFTNAVIQDIIFSNDGHWIMISSSRGTNHLFSVPPPGGSVNFQFPDACFTGKNSGSDVMTTPVVCSPPNSGLNMLNQLNLSASSPPLTLSALGRIRSGNSGWRNTVNGAAAAATGRMRCLSGAIASAFHNCRSENLLSDASDLKEKHHLLVFSPSGCMVQYTLRLCSGQESAVVVSELGSCESIIESDARLVVEATYKWNICQKQNRREREDNVDIYGENGHLDSSKIFPEEFEKENGGYPENKGSVSKLNINPEEKNCSYSEVELHTHQAQIPLWKKSQIYFQLMTIDGIKIGGNDAYGGEIEIERVPTRMIEVRSTSLVPVPLHLQTPKFMPTRITTVESNANGPQLHQMSGLSESDRVSCHRSSGFLESMSGDAAVDKLQGGTEETKWEGLHMPTRTTKGSINNVNFFKSDNQLGIVDNRVRSTKEVRTTFVNNSIGDIDLEIFPALEKVD